MPGLVGACKSRNCIINYFGTLQLRPDPLNSDAFPWWLLETFAQVSQIHILSNSFCEQAADLALPTFIILSLYDSPDLHRKRVWF